MTNVQERFVNLIQQFKHVRFLASCEGFGDIHEYLRFPAKWSVFENNIRKLAQYDAGKIQIMCTPVVQSVNLLDITKFFEWIESINEEYGFERISILPIVLTFPQHLDFGILPEEMKIEGLSRLETFLATSKYTKHNPHFMGRINFVRDKCLKDSYNEELLHKFKDFTNMLDSHRKQSLANVNPQLYDLLTKLPPV
jgi:glutamate-1-semialdehyde 2,1-aminomutase